MSSNAHPIDIAIFVVFLIVTLVVGLSHGRQAKTIRDYALGGKNFSTATLIATILATYFGGGSFYYGLANTYSQGLSFYISLLGAPLCLLLTGQVLAVRMGNFLNNLSVAEAMGEMYGKKIRSISAISGIAGQIGYVAIQFQVIARVLSLFFGKEDESLTVLASAIVILYSTMGGIRAVTFTDVIQFFTFGTFLPMLALIVWRNFQDPYQIAVTLAQNPKFHFKEVVGWNTSFASAIALMLFYIMQGITPPIFQRISMARNSKQAQKAFTYSAFIAFLIISCIAWVGVLLLADNPNLEPGKLVNYLIEKYTYVGFKGLLAIGLVALAMSTADSYINSCAVLFANDLAVPLGWGNSQSTIITRLSAFVVGTLALLLTLYEKNLLSLLLLTSSFYLPIVGMPLLLAVLGFRSSKRAVLIGMAAGFTTVILWRNFMAHTGIDGVMPATLASALFLLGSHYLLGEPGGWQPVDPDSPLALERAARKAAWRRRIHAVKTFKLYPYLQQNLPQQEGLYTVFGFYTIAATYTAFYTISDSSIQSHRDIYEGIYHTVLFATTAFITFPIWPPTVKSERFIVFFWPLGIMAILFFAGTLLVILSGFHTMQVMVLMINLLIAVFILSWSFALILALSGVGLAVWFFKAYTGLALPWNELGSLQFKMFYGLLLISSLLIVLFRGKQAYAQLSRKNEMLTRLDQENKASLLQAAVEHNKALQTVQSSSMHHLLTIAKDLQSIQAQGTEAGKLHAVQAALVPVAFQLQGIDARAQDYLRLKVTPFPIQQWLNNVQEILHAKDIMHLVRLRQTHQTLTGDPEQLTTLLTKSIVALQAHTEEQEEAPTMVLALEDTLLCYPLPDVEKGYTRQVPALRITITTKGALPPLAPSYKPSLASTTHTPPNTSEALEQFANGRIIKAHYGYAAVSAHTLLYVIPLDVKQVRPKDMDKSYMELGASPERANDHFKNDMVDAQAQEQEFLAAVEQRSKANISLIKIALELIKWYHGPVKRHTKEPFYLHPMAVAQIVLDYNQDEATLLGALLHDTVEDTSMLIQHIGTVFGKETAEVVDLVTHLQSIEGSLYKVKLTAAENLQMLERSGNKRGLYVKLADRMHNVRTINGHKNAEKRKLIAEETMKFFVPLAEKISLQGAANELKERCSAVLTS